MVANIQRNVVGTLKTNFFFLKYFCTCF